MSTDDACGRDHIGLAGGVGDDGPVSRVLSEGLAAPRMTIYLGRRSPVASSDLPGSRSGPGRPASPTGLPPPTPAPLFGLAPGGVCRARAVARPAGELLPRRFTLTPTAEAAVAVSFLWHFPYPVARAVGVTHHRALAESGLSSRTKGNPRRRGLPRSSGHPARHHRLASYHATAGVPMSAMPILPVPRAALASKIST